MGQATTGFGFLKSQDSPPSSLLTPPFLSQWLTLFLLSALYEDMELLREEEELGVRKTWAPRGHRMSPWLWAQLWLEHEIFPWAYVSERSVIICGAVAEGFRTFKKWCIMGGSRHGVWALRFDSLAPLFVCSLRPVCKLPYSPVPMPSLL